MRTDSGPMSTARDVFERNTSTSVMVSGMMCYVPMPQVEPDEFDQLLARHSGVAHGTFFDIGSGTGKCVLQAALSGRFDRVVGIEVMHSTHAIAEVLLQEFQADILPEIAPKHVDVECRRVSLLDDTSWLDAEFVYCCNVAFPDTLTEQIAVVAEGMRPGTIIVTVMVPLPSNQFRVLEAYSKPAFSSSLLSLYGLYHHCQPVLFPPEMTCTCWSYPTVAPSIPPKT